MNVVLCHRQWPSGRRAKLRCSQLASLITTPPPTHTHTHTHTQLAAPPKTSLSRVHCAPTADIVQASASGLLLLRWGAHVPPAIAALGQACLHPSPRARPTAAVSKLACTHSHACAHAHTLHVCTDCTDTHIHTHTRTCTRTHARTHTRTTQF